MPVNFLVAVGKLPNAAIPATSQLREKWTGAMLDDSGRSHCGAVRLDAFGADTCRFLDAIADTLAGHPILAASFNIEGQLLVGKAPTSRSLRNAIRAQLAELNNTVTDREFLAHCAFDPTAPGLRVVASESGNTLTVRLGFWIFTCDGVSIDLLMREIVDRYSGRTPEPHTCWSAYFECIPKEEKQPLHIRTGIYPNSGPFGLDACSTVTSASGAGASLPFSFGLSTEDLSKAARRMRATPFAVLFAAYQRAIAIETGLPHIVTGVPFANRQSEMAQRVVGPIANTVPVVTRHTGCDDFTTEVKASQVALMQAASRQHVNTASLYPEGLSPRTSKSVLPFPQLFNATNASYAGRHLHLGEKAELMLSLLPNDTHRVPFEVTMNGELDQVSGRFEMNAEAFGAYAPRIRDSMEAALDALA